MHIVCNGFHVENHSMTDYDLELIAQTAHAVAPVTSQPISVNAFKAYKLPSVRAPMMFLPVVSVDNSTNSQAS